MSEALYSAVRWKTYTLGTTTIDIMAEGGGPCRAIWVDTDSTLQLTPQGGAGTPDPTPFKAGTRHDLQAIKINSTSDSPASSPSGTKIVVFW